jgi:hypothetical protein
LFETNTKEYNKEVENGLSNIKFEIIIFLKNIQLNKLDSVLFDLFEKTKGG